MPLGQCGISHHLKRKHYQQQVESQETLFYDIKQINHAREKTIIFSILSVESIIKLLSDEKAVEGNIAKKLSGKKVSQWCVGATNF